MRQSLNLARFVSGRQGAGPIAGGPGSAAPGTKLRRAGHGAGVLYAAGVSKPPRPADPRQTDLFAPADPSAGAGVQAAPPHAAPARPRRARRAPPDTTPADAAPVPPPPASPPSAPSDAVSPDARPTPAETPVARPQAASASGPQPREIAPALVAGDRARPEFRRIDPLGLRAADRPDACLYCVVTREAADRLLREGMEDEDPPTLVERGTVPRQLAAMAEELGWSDEQPGAIVVLRVRRGELARADAAPHTDRLRRQR